MTKREYVRESIEAWMKARNKKPADMAHLIGVSVDSVFYEATEDDLNRDTRLLQKYVNVISAEMNAETDVSQELADKIKDALIAYRTDVCKKKRIKAYEVFRNISCERIAKFAPMDIDALKALRCLDEAQIKTYGSDIIDIVIDIIKPLEENN